MVGIASAFDDLQRLIERIVIGDGKAFDTAIARRTGAEVAMGFGHETQDSEPGTQNQGSFRARADVMSS